MQAAATYFDGRTAGAHAGTITCLGSVVQFQSAEHSVSFEMQDAELSAPIGSGEWIIELDDGASLRFSDNQVGEELRELAGHSRWIDFLESAWQWAVIALVIAVLGTWAFLTYGVPIGARYVAFSLPPDIDYRLSEESVDLLDRLMFESSALPDERKDELRELFDQIQSRDEEYQNYRLEFRASEDIGANAFAVPGGVVIITDEMVELAQNDVELVSVLAHEVGHLAQRHSLRIILQNSVSAVFIAGLTGDLTNITALSATVPTMLMQSKYSRDFEMEADEFAFAYLESEGMDTDSLSKLLLRVESESDGETFKQLEAWFSSHPQSADRKPSNEN